MRMGTTLRLATAPTIPHTFSPLFLYGPLPAGNAHLLRARERELTGRRVLGERGTRSQRGSTAHPDRRDQLGVRADEDIVLYDRAMLVRAVVVAHDGARADVDIFAYVAVADVSQMVRLRAFAYATRLDLDEVADVNLRREPRSRAGTHARVGPDVAVGADVRVLQVAKGLDPRPCAHGSVPEHAVRANGDPVGQADFTLEHAIDV